MAELRRVGLVIDGFWSSEASGVLRSDATGLKFVSCGVANEKVLNYHFTTPSS